METSADDDIIFAGGSTTSDVKNGEGIIFALTFDENIDYIADLTLPRSSSSKNMGVSTIRRFRDMDVLYLGTFGSIFVIEWTGTHFEILNQVPDLHSCKNFL